MCIYPHKVQAPFQIKERNNLTTFIPGHKDYTCTNLHQTMKCYLSSMSLVEQLLGNQLANMARFILLVECDWRFDGHCDENKRGRKVDRVQNFLDSLAVKICHIETHYHMHKTIKSVLYLHFCPTLFVTLSTGAAYLLSYQHLKHWYI